MDKSNSGTSMSLIQGHSETKGEEGGGPFLVLDNRRIKVSVLNQDLGMGKLSVHWMLCLCVFE